MGSHENLSFIQLMEVNTTKWELQGVSMWVSSMFGDWWRVHMCVHLCMHAFAFLCVCVFTPKGEFTFVCRSQSSRETLRNTRNTKKYEKKEEDRIRDSSPKNFT